MGLTSLLVGLARGVGIPAYYVDASRNPERRTEVEVNVVAGHIGAVVYTKEGPLIVDFTGELMRGYRYRRMSDLEAAAHYYNNLGYELIHRAEEAGQPIPWQEVSRQFARATRIAPGFARAWNNLGVASVRLGQFDRAERSYQQALRLEPGLDSPRLNLAALATRGVPLLSLAEDPALQQNGPLLPSLRDGAEVGAPDPTTTESASEAEPGSGVESAPH
jgi:tetratricopeptide (TPR) repeat protein